jgi:hypothetical protein
MFLLVFTSSFGTGSETSSYRSGSGKKFWILTDPDLQHWFPSVVGPCGFDRDLLLTYQYFEEKIELAIFSYRYRVPVPFKLLYV